MKALLYINGKKIKFWVNLGWFRGEPFALFSITLLAIEKYETVTVDILRMQVAYLMFAFGFCKLDE
jgi:hypothetical protein